MLASVSPRIPPSLSRLRARIFWFVGLHPQGVTKQEIFDFLYDDDPNGGPEGGICHINVLLTQFNKKLRLYGLRIAMEYPRRYSTPYNLRRLDNNNIWLPRIDR